MTTGLYRNGTRSRAECGFSYMEMLVAMGIILIAMAVAFNFVIKFSSAVSTESTTLATQQSGRVVLDEITRHIQMIGYNIRRPSAFNPGVWQHALIYGGAHELVFNADISSQIGWLPGGQSLIQLPNLPVLQVQFFPQAREILLHFLEILGYNFEKVPNFLLTVATQGFLKSLFQNAVVVESHD